MPLHQPKKGYPQNGTQITQFVFSFLFFWRAIFWRFFSLGKPKKPTRCVSWGRYSPKGHSCSLLGSTGQGALPVPAAARVERRGPGDWIPRCSQRLIGTGCKRSLGPQAIGALSHPFLFSGDMRFPYKKSATERKAGYPYSSLSTGGPRRGGVAFRFVVFPLDVIICLGQILSPQCIRSPKQ